jgi:DNA-binding NarL/FixJ family response regulator
MERAAKDGVPSQMPKPGSRALSGREREVALATGQGKTNAEIAADLAMSVPTVKAHITHALTKLGVTNRTQIALLVHDAGRA